jgi:hypothetical protein|tara:strand:- start:133 stop:387 length:255 start_codon:yes stop_codon:yes gene_type:complete
MTKEYNKKAEEMKKILSVKDNAKEERSIKVTNPYSGQSEMLTMSEAIHYFMIKKFEEIGQYKLMQEGLSKFSRLNPKAYMTLLD